MPEYYLRKRFFFERMRFRGLVEYFLPIAEMYSVWAAIRQVA